MPRLKAKVDGNQADIVEALRSAGATVQHLHQLGQGCPDLLIGFRDRNYLLEIKDGRLSPSRRRLTAQEADWARAWRGQVTVVESVQEALGAIGAT